MCDVCGIRIDSYRDEVSRLLAERDQLREALAEAIRHVEPVDQNSELAIAEWHALATGRETVQPGQFHH